MRRRYNKDRKKFPLEVKDKLLVSYLKRLERAEDKERKNREFCIDDRVEDLITLLRHGLKIRGNRIGNFIYGIETLKDLTAYQNLYDRCSGERKDRQKQLKNVRAKIVRLGKTKAENIDHFDQLKSQQRDLLQTEQLLKQKLESIPSANHVDSIQTWRYTVNDPEAIKLKFGKFDKDLNNEIRTKKMDKLLDHIEDRRMWYSGMLMKNREITDNQWRAEWKEIKKRL